MIKYLIFDIGGVLSSHGQLNLPLIGLCSQLVSAGFKLGIISNHTHVSAALLSTNLFDPILNYGQTGLIKPDPKLFTLFFHQTNSSASECLFIDDTQSNITSARALGVRSIYYQSFYQLKSDLISLNILKKSDCRYDSS